MLIRSIMFVTAPEVSPRYPATSVGVEYPVSLTVIERPEGVLAHPGSGAELVDQARVRAHDSGERGHQVGGVVIGCGGCHGGNSFHVPNQGARASPALG